MEIESELITMTPLLSKRIEIMDQINRLPWSYAFMSAQSLAELDHFYQISKNINRKQGEEILYFTDLQKNLEKEKSRLLKIAKDIVELKRNVNQREKRISQNQKSKKVLLQKLNKMISKRKKSLSHLKGLGKKVALNSEFKNLDILFGTDFFDKKGQLKSPHGGPLIQEFGLNRQLGKDLVELVHKGHFYQGEKGDPIHSVEGGRVRLSQKIPGYGHTVIIDHGGRYYSTYANMDHSVVKKNQIISNRQKLGTVGHRHLQFGLGLYFEIRHFSEPQDPEKWLKRKQKKLATL